MTKISDKIVKYMSTLEWPATTEDIAKALKISWNTAQVHLLKLQAEGKVKFRKVGRQNQWWLERRYKDNF
jgi:predicted ArsR family transcriptional regulator